ncbi:hypothetical protein [uncultured Methylibium sp.]|uniref:hypothetical protein n=1 Tax=uncultured Methylibium sp. TaxID=381093 RepID=UPI0025E7CC0A|nr:hypothetical protein [uncultured Methylibium sp.]
MSASAAQRLEASRARLRSAWQARRGDASPGGLPPSGDGLLPWLEHALTSWWNKHPLKGIAQVAADVAEPAARSLLTPEAERHPLRLVALAAGAGALVIAVRPWRWLPQAALSSLLLGALWPHGSLQRWLSGGGLMRWLASGELSRLVAGLAGAPAAADAPTPASPASAASTASPAAQADAAMSYSAPRPAPMATTATDS